MVRARLTEHGLSQVDESGTCCYATQNKVWVDGPDGAWEIYTVVEDSDTFGTSSTHADDFEVKAAVCCSDAPESAARCC